jgi:negative regulator of sigma E activity
MEYLTAPLKDVVIVTDGSRTWRCDPRAGTVGNSGGRNGCERKLGLFLDNHVVQKIGSDRTAGRSAYILAIKSTSGQLRKKMWVDASTHIILRSEDYDPRGKVLSTTNYRSIKYNPTISDQLFKPADDPNCSGGACKTMSRDELSKAVGFSVRTPRYVPKGYRLENYRLYDCPCKCGHKSAYLRYTNGMNGISIFQAREHSGCSKGGECGAHGGKCLVGNQMVAKSVNGISYVVMGNVKSDELRRIADSLR